MKELYRDCTGTPFADHATWLPASTSFWPHPTQQKADLAAWRANWEGKPCWWCQGSTRASFGLRVGELHHLKTGVEELAMYTWLCANCHRHSGVAVTEEALGRLLFLKWRNNPEHVYWVGIALRLRKRLPDLITE